MNATQCGDLIRSMMRAADPRSMGDAEEMIIRLRTANDTPPEVVAETDKLISDWARVWTALGAGLLSTCRQATGRSGGDGIRHHAGPQVYAISQMIIHPDRSKLTEALSMMILMRIQGPQPEPGEKDRIDDLQDEWKARWQSVGEVALYRMRRSGPGVERDEPGDIKCEASGEPKPRTRPRTPITQEEVRRFATTMEDESVFRQWLVHGDTNGRVNSKPLVWWRKGVKDAGDGIVSMYKAELVPRPWYAGRLGVDQQLIWDAVLIRLGLTNTWVSWDQLEAGHARLTPFLRSMDSDRGEVEIFVAVCELCDAQMIIAHDKLPKFQATPMGRDAVKRILVPRWEQMSGLEVK